MRKERDSVRTVESFGTDYSDRVEIDDESDIDLDEIKSHPYIVTFECIASVIHQLVVGGEKLRRDGHVNGSQYEIFINRSQVCALLIV